MILIFVLLAGLPILFLALAIWFPSTFQVFGHGAGRAAIVVLVLLHCGLLAATYWLRFARISPLMLRLTSAKCCLVGVWTSAIVPWTLFGLSKLRLPGFGDLAIEFGDTGLASAAALVISLFALNHFSAEYERLSRPENLPWSSTIPIERELDHNAAPPTS